MDVKILYKNLWTYNTIILPKDRKIYEEKLPISYLDKEVYTHIHGELQIIIGERNIPNLGFDGPDDVCFGYWIEMLTDLFKQINRGITSYTIEGGEQGKPGYKFDMQGEYIYLSIVDSPLGGKKDLNWQKVEFKWADFKREFKKFKEEFLGEITIKAPSVLEEWSKKFISK